MSDVTVIIPVYNTGQYIDRCMNMVISQSFQNFNVILIDGGSSDESPEKCLAWSRRESRVSFVCKAGLKLGPARNLGVKMSEAEYVTFYDSDDFWHKDYLRLMMEGTENSRNDIVLCDINNLRKRPDGSFEKNKSTLRFPSGRLNLEAEWNLINIARTFAWGKLYRRSLFERYDIWEPAHAYEDVATVPYIIARAESVYHVSVALYSYVRNNHENDMHSFLLYAEMEKSLRILIEKFKRDHLHTIFYPQLRQMFWGQLCFLCRIFRTVFCNIDSRYRESVITRTKAYIYSEFPELKFIEKMKFYVLGNPLCFTAVSHIVLDAEQIVCCASAADVAILDTEFRFEDSFDGLVIKVDVSKNSCDNERESWDMADQIFHKLLSRQ